MKLQRGFIVLTVLLLLVSGQENQRSPLDGTADTLCSRGDGSSKWTVITSKAPWASRTGHGAVSFQGKIWVIGGEGERNSSSESGSLLADVSSSYDGYSWTSLPPHNAWSGRHRFGIVSFNNKIWLLGGIISGANGTREVTNEVWSSGVDGETWYQARENTPCSTGQTLCLPANLTANQLYNATNASIAPVWAQRHTPVTMVFKGRMWLISGVRSSLEQTRAQTSDFIHDVWSTADGVQWTRETASTPWSGRRTTVGVMYQLKMYVLAESIDFRYYYNVWGSTDGINWAEPTGACTVSGQLLGAALVLESGVVVVGAAGAYEDRLADTTLWYSRPGVSLFDGRFDQSNRPVASGARAESAYLAFLGKMWQIGGSCGSCGPAGSQARQTFSDVQVGTALTFPVSTQSKSSATSLFASSICTAFCVAAGLLHISFLTERH